MSSVRSLPVVIAAGIGWLGASWIASRIASSAQTPHEARGSRAFFGTSCGASVWSSPTGPGASSVPHDAIGPITSITLDQIGQGIVLTLSLVVFRHAFGRGGRLVLQPDRGRRDRRPGRHPDGGQARRAVLEAEDRRPLRFVVGGIALIAVSFLLRDWTILLASFAVGLTFAWKKISVDTMVPGGDPRRVSRSRVQRLRRRLQPRPGRRGGARDPDDPRGSASRGPSRSWASSSFCGLPVVGRWYGREPELEIRFAAGGQADETLARSIVWGGAEEPVEVVRTWREERDGERRLAFRLALGRRHGAGREPPEPDGPWRLDREGERHPPRRRPRAVRHRVRRPEPRVGSHG